MASYNVNYNDNRFKQVENEKNAQLNEYNQRYDNLINEREKYTQDQQNYVDTWQKTQEQINNDNLQHQIDLYNQQKDKAERDYKKEASAGYADYQKEVDRYGVSRENVVANGLSNSGYAESSKVDMYNTYLNRLASAKSNLNNAMLEFDNAIKEATLQNNATLAENALTALKQKLDIALEGFNYKTEQENNRMNWNYNINNNYYNRYKDVESQINYENEQAEALRRYNEEMAYKKKQQELEQQRWEKEFAYQQQQAAIANAQKWASSNASNSSSSGSSTSLSNGSSSSGGASLSGNSNSSGKKLTNVKKYSPNLSSQKANNWYSTNIDNVYFKSGLTESQLDKIISNGLSSGIINKSDINKILNTFGL